MELHKLRTLAAVTTLVVLGVLLQVGQAHATPARAQALGGLDPYHPGINTAVYFNDDVNVFVNPALMYRYRNTVDLSLGVEGGANSGVGADPYGGFLLEMGKSGVVLGLFLNRNMGHYGETNGLDGALTHLLPNGLGGAYATSTPFPTYGRDWRSVAPRFPLDMFIGGHFGETTIGANVYVAGGIESGSSEALRNPGSDDPDIWDYADEKAKTMYTSIRIGFQHDGGSFKPGAYVGFAKLDSWRDRFVNSSESDEDTVDSHTEGLSGAMRITAGGRFEIDYDYLVIIPHIGFSYGMGGLFMDENLGDATIVGNEANNEYKANGLDLNAGSGFTYKPKDDLKIIWTTSVQLRRSQLNVNDHYGDLDKDTPDGAKTYEATSTNTLFAGPVVSVAAEYRPFKHLRLRGGIRANVLFGRDTTRGTDYVDSQMQNDVRLMVDQPNEPSLVASFGLSVPMGVLTMEGTFGGLVMGSADQQFFSRLDMKVKW